mgnify:FL=1
MNNRYDKYKRIAHIQDQEHLRDSESYQLIPSSEYYTIQAKLIDYIHRTKFKGKSIDEAVNWFIDNHAELFSRTWNEQPCAENEVYDYYIKTFID